MAEIRRKGTSKWMRGDHHPTYRIDHLPQLFGALNPRDVFLQATDENVPQVRAHFHASD
jgi:hypothetical protein